MKNNKKIWFIVSLALGSTLIYCLLPLAAKGGFGISPPYVRNDSLTRGSHYEQKIVLVRSNPTEDLKAKVTVNVPKANDWFSIDKGTEFILPKGKQQVPIIISVDVPRSADFGRYKGNLGIKTSSLKPLKGGTVTIALGAQIDVDLNVVKVKIFDFKVKGVGVSDLEEGHKFWFWYIPGKIRFSMKIENIGNIKAVPTNVHFDIYDSEEKNLLESVDAVKIGPKVKPFETKKIIAELPTKLKPGSYWAKFKIFKKEEVVSEGKIHLSILPYGTLPVHVGLEFFGLNLWLWLVILVVICSIVGTGCWIWLRIRRKKILK